MDEILAAGAVVWRPGAPDGPDGPDGVEVALVHRPRYDDWSLPKGKLRSHESMAAGAVREIEEETGVRALLGAWLGDVRYLYDGRPKRVRYWGARAAAALAFTPNDEVDELRWVRPDAAPDLLTYGHDVGIVQRFTELGPPTSVLLLVRHARAGSRDRWDGDDRLRPLSKAGTRQAQHLAELLRLFGPDRVHAATLVRCHDTVAPLATELGLSVEDEPLLDERSYGDDPDATMARLREVAALPGVTALSSQGGVIPDAVATLARHAAQPVAVDLDRAPPSKKGSVWVLALRGGTLVSADYVERATG